MLSSASPPLIAARAERAPGCERRSGEERYAPSHPRMRKSSCCLLPERLLFRKRTGRGEEGSLRHEDEQIQRDHVTDRDHTTPNNDWNHKFLIMVELK